jgi:hypothetical protein
MLYCTSFVELSLKALKTAIAATIRFDRYIFILTDPHVAHVAHVGEIYTYTKLTV